MEDREGMDGKRNDLVFFIVFLFVIKPERRDGRGRDMGYATLMISHFRFGFLHCDRSKYMPFAVTGVVQFEEEPLLYSVPDAWPCYQTIPSLLVRTNPSKYPQQTLGSSPSPKL